MAENEGGAASAASLASKLATIMGELGDLTRGGHALVETRTGGSYKYDYIQEAAIMAALRPLLVKHNVAMLYSDETVYRGSEATGDANLVSVRVTLTFVNGDNPKDSYPLTGTADGTDYSDKAASKAKTTATRYLLLKTFLQGGMDVDPEQEAVERTSAPARVSDQQPRERRQEGPAPAQWGPAKVLDELERLGVPEPKAWLKQVVLREYEVEMSNWRDIPEDKRQEALDRLNAVYRDLTEEGYGPDRLPPPDDYAVQDAFAEEFSLYGDWVRRAEEAMRQEMEAERFTPAEGDVEGGEADGQETADSGAEGAGGPERADGRDGRDDDAPDGAEGDEPGD
jgi:ERF superfamily